VRQMRSLRSFSGEPSLISHARAWFIKRMHRIR
jgi:hypothetical protein